MENGNSYTILTVDDQPDTLDFLSNLLRRQGYQVRAAGTGAEGIAMAEDPAVDLVLLEIMLPDINGFDVCLKIKEGRPLLPIIHLTVRDQPIDAITGLDSGADDFITKPFNSAVLLARIRAALRKNQTQVNGKNDARISDALRTVAQPLDPLLQPKAIADTVIQRAGSVLDVEHSAVCIWQQEVHGAIRAHLSVSDPTIERVLQNLGPEWDQTLYQELRTRQEPIIGAGSRPLPPALVPFHAELDSCTTLIAPLLSQRRLYGALILLRNSGSTFDAQELDTVATVACQAGIALDYARLLSEIEENPPAGSDRSQNAPQLLPIISHELRTPVAAIKGFITTLLSSHRYWDDDECEAFLENVNVSVDQLSRLIENVLEMGRLDQGLELHRRPTRLALLVQRVLHGLSFKSSRCEFVNEIPANLPVLATDPLKIQRVLRNLFENAIKFSPQGGRIRVFASQKDTEIEIGVEDQGIGIAPEHLPHIFERFYQVDQREVPKEGVGLGLSIVRELVHTHGGRVWAESVRGSGTTVYFSLPMNGAAVVAKPAMPDKKHKELDLNGQSDWTYRPGGPPLILIVEDDLLMARALHKTLDDEGLEVLTISHGNEAIELVRTEKPDLVLLDLMLPDIDGLVVCDRVRQFSNVPIIIISGRTDEPAKLQGLNRGADDYLVKPFSNKELLARIRAVLRRTSASGSIEPPSCLRFNGLEIDPARHEVNTPKGPVRLTPTEHKLLFYLASNAGHILTHRQLLTQVWGYECERQIDYLWVNISRLRKKIEPDPSQPCYIITEPELGYSFVGPDGTH